jgi:hypothetical protein
MKIASYIFFTSAYEARCAVEPLKSLGRVSLGQTVVTPRVVASKVINQIRMLISEADGYLTQSHPASHLHRYKNLLKDYYLHLQEWIDKDGRVSFIKLKLVDLSYKIFKGGESGWYTY